MTETVKAKGPVVKDSTRELADLIKKAMKIEGAVITAEEKLYETLLPEGVTAEQALAISKRNHDIIAASSLAVGEIGITAMKKDKTLSNVTCTIPMVGRDVMEFSFDKSKEISNSPLGNGTPGTHTKYGSITAAVKCHAVKKTGQFGAVKAFLAEQATAAFGK